MPTGHRRMHRYHHAMAKARPSRDAALAITGQTVRDDGDRYRRMAADRNGNLGTHV